MKKLITAALSLGLLAPAGLLVANQHQEKKMKNPTVTVKTSLGTFKAELYADKAPVSVENFLKYVDAKFYDGTTFHRVIAGFMIQGGGFTKDFQKKETRAPIVNEGGNGLKNQRGTLAMARTSDPNSASSQFFVNTVDNAFLDRENAQDRVGYAVFGKVTEGMDVVDKIRNVPTGRGPMGMGDVPTTPVLIESIRKD